MNVIINQAHEAYIIGISILQVRRNYFYLGNNTQAQLLCAHVAQVLVIVFSACNFVACDAEEFKGKNQLVDARTSKHVKMAEPEFAFDHAEAIHSYAQESLYTRAHTHTVLNYTFTKMQKTIPEATDSINPRIVQIL